MKVGFEFDNVIVENPEWLLKLESKWPRLFLFLRDMMPEKYCPNAEYNFIFSSRPTRHLKRTARWLKSHKIQYREAVLFYDYKGKMKPTKAQVADFKAKSCLNNKIKIYVEPDDELLELIQKRVREKCRVITVRGAREEGFLF